MTHKCAFYVNQSKTKCIFAITVNHSRCTVVAKGAVQPRKNYIGNLYSNITKHIL